MLDRKYHDSCFPPKRNRTLWRYMDLWKFLNMIENRKLIFVRADQFEDNYEGMLPKKNVHLLCAPTSPSKKLPRPKEQTVKIMEQMKKTMFISSWHIGKHESAAMWKLYCNNNDGIAIRSDYTALVNALDKSKLISRTTVVKYIDYDHDVFPTDNLFCRFTHKRRSFAHEKELRAIILPAESDLTTMFKDYTTLGVDIDPDELIKSIYVAPTAPEWFGVLLEKIVQRYKLKIPVVRSKLYDRPLY